MIKQDSDVCHLVSEEIKPKKIHSIVITYSLELVGMVFLRFIAENLLRMWFLKIIGFFIAKLFIDLLII